MTVKINAALRVAIRQGSLRVGDRSSQGVIESGTIHALIRRGLLTRGADEGSKRLVGVWTEPHFVMNPQLELDPHAARMGDMIREARLGSVRMRQGNGWGAWLCAKCAEETRWSSVVELIAEDLQRAIVDDATLHLLGGCK